MRVLQWPTVSYTSKKQATENAVGSCPILMFFLLLLLLLLVVVVVVVVVVLVVLLLLLLLLLLFNAFSTPASVSTGRNLLQIPTGPCFQPWPIHKPQIGTTACNKQSAYKRGWHHFDAFAILRKTSTKTATP